LLDATAREKLRNIVNRSIRKASVKTEVSAQTPDNEYGIVITSDSIDHFYKGKVIASVKMAELADSEIIDFIKADPEETASALLEEYVESMQTSASLKTAANSALDKEVGQKITQKQLDDNNVALHPRTGKSPTKIIEKTLKEEGEQSGTYDKTTEAQLRETKTTFKGETLEHARQGEVGDTGITESQLDKDAADTAGAERGEVGSEFSGDQHRMITEKQLGELLSHNGWSEPRTITEGDDQLGKQDGELARLEASAAEKLVKEAMTVLAKTVASLGVTPEEVLNTVKSLTSSPNKEPVLASVLSQPKDISDIKQSLKRYKFHGKVASTTTNKLAIASAVLRQLSNIKTPAKLLASALYAVAQADESSITDLINDSMLEDVTVTEEDNSVKSVLANIVKNKNYKTTKASVEGDASDGLYQYAGKISEVSESPTNRESFAKKAFEVTKQQIVKTASVNPENLVPITLNVDENEGTFVLTAKDSTVTDPNKLKVRAARREQLAKQAQMPGGGMPPGPGGAAAPMAGPPGMPGDAAGAGGQPGVESFNAPPPGEEDGEEGDLSGGGTPKPPGSSCPVCGSENVDVDHGQFRCQNTECGAEGEIEVLFRVKKYPDVLQDSEKGEEGEEEGFELGGELGGEPGAPGADMGAPGAEGGMAPPNVPVAASVRITPRMLEKLASNNIKLGGTCPNCGSHKCDLNGSNGICFECNNEYKFKLFANKKEPHKLLARFEWAQEAEGCSSCNRFKTAFRKALDDYGMSWDEFHNQPSWREKGETILNMQRAHLLDPVLASVNEFSKIEKLASTLPARWQGYDKFESFPKQSCVERLNRRFGENAASLSGPCRGKKLADCVCSQLENQGIYTDGVAAKVAQVHMSNDALEQFPTEECIKKMQNENFRLKESGLICNCLKAAYASYEDLLIEKVANTNPNQKRVKTAQGMVPGVTPGAAPKPAMKPTPKPMPNATPMTPEMSKPLPTEGAEPTGPEDDFGTEEVDISAPEGDAVDVDLSGGDESLNVETEGDFGGDEGFGDESVDVSMESPEGMEEEVDVNVAPEGELGGEMTEEPLGDMGETDMGDEMVDVTDAVTSPAQQLGDALQGVIEEAIQKATGNAVSPDAGVGGELGGEVGGEMGGEVGGPDLDPNSTPPMDSDDSLVEGLDEAEGHEHFEGPEGEIHDETGELESPEDIETVEGENTEEVPGLGNQDEINGEGIAKEGDEPKPAPQKPAPAPAPKANKPEEKQESEQSEPSESEQKEASRDSMLNKMKKGTITKEAQGLDNLIEGFLKQAAQEPEKFKYISLTEKKTGVTNAQDTSDIGEFSSMSKSKMGNEDSFDKDVKTKPDVPRKKQLLGSEGDDMGVSETDTPKIPAGTALLKGEEHYKAEKQTEIDGNQGGNKVASTKIACACGDPKCDCKGCSSGKCKKPCAGKCASVITAKSKYYKPLTKKLAEGKKVIKVAGSIYKIAMNEDKTISAEKLTKVAFAVDSKHNLFKGLQAKLAKKETLVTLNDGVTYKMTPQKNNTIILTAEKTKPSKDKKDKDGEVHVELQPDKKERENNPKLPKEAQSTSTLTRKDKGLQDDKDIAPVKSNKTHSMAKDEQPLTEGGPDVPSAPSNGQLKNEHTFDNKLNGPDVPVGGGVNKQYDTNGNDPEKTTETLGNTGTEVIAEAKADIVKEATRIAGEMLKQEKITTDDLQDKIAYLSQLPMPLLKQFETDVVKKAEQTFEAGLQKKASLDEMECNPGLLISRPSAPKNQGDLKSSLEEVFSYGRHDLKKKDFN